MKVNEVMEMLDKDYAENKEFFDLMFGQQTTQPKAKKSKK